MTISMTYLQIAHVPLEFTAQSDGSKAAPPDPLTAQIGYDSNIAIVTMVPNGSALRIEPQGAGSFTLTYSNPDGSVAAISEDVVVTLPPPAPPLTAAFGTATFTQNPQA